MRFQMFIKNSKISYSTQRYFASKRLSTAEYCLDSVRTYDKENFLCSILLKNKIRACALAVRAFNVEIARIQDQVNDPKIGLMRFQFWENAITELFKQNENQNIPNHPVIYELRKLIDNCKLNKRYFLRILTCRRDHLTQPFFKTMDNLENYTEQSVSSVYYLLLEGSNINNVHADHTASHLGKAQGLINMLRSLQHGTKDAYTFLPQELFLQYDVNQEQFIRRQSTKNIKDVSFHIASVANQHLEKARSLSKSIPAEAKSLFLPGVAIDLYLKQLRQHDFDIFASNLKKSNPLLPFLLWMNLKLSKY